MASRAAAWFKKKIFIRKRCTVMKKRLWGQKWAKKVIVGHSRPGALQETGFFLGWPDSSSRHDMIGWGAINFRAYLDLLPITSVSSLKCLTWWLVHYAHRQHSTPIETCPFGDIATALLRAI